MTTYTITHTDGTLITNLPAQTVDTASSALTLVGQGDLGYGQALNDNLIRLLENFADTISPYPPYYGMLWYDATTGFINVYDNTSSWEPLATQAWVDANYLDQSGTYATESWVIAQGYATENYLTQQGYATQTFVTSRGYLTQNQTITLTGDVTGSGSANIAMTLAATGVSSGTYEKVTVDAKGRVVQGNSLSQQDIITALGYTPASSSGSPNITQFDYGALGTAGYDNVQMLSLVTTNANTNSLYFWTYRNATTGNDWTTASTRMQLQTDTTQQGFVEFNTQSVPGSVGLGSNDTGSGGGKLQFLCSDTYVQSLNQNFAVQNAGGGNANVYFQNGTQQSFVNEAVMYWEATSGLLRLSANGNGTNSVNINSSGVVSLAGIAASQTTTPLTITYGNSSNVASLSLNTDGSLTVLNPNSAGAVLIQANGDYERITNNQTAYWKVIGSNFRNVGAMWCDQNANTWNFSTNYSNNAWTNDITFGNGGQVYANFFGYQADPSTGFDNPAVGDLGLTSSGVRRFRLYSSGSSNLWYGSTNEGDGSSTLADRFMAWQNNGDCVIYTGTSTPLWAANTATSDARLKENVKDFEGGLTAINALRPITFQWKKDSGLHDGKTHVGFLAQEVEEIHPHAVSQHGDNKTKLLHKEELVPHLVRAAQELATENELLKNKVGKLEQKLATMEQEMNGKIDMLRGLLSSLARKE